jgi:hypothetical protein
MSSRHCFPKNEPGAKCHTREFERAVGIALAPADFGHFSNRLLVGNFGDGTIDAFDPATDAFLCPIGGH